MMFIGIDDTDSVKGMCTTYLAARLCQELKVEGLPRLIRLNPNIPYKTRGNAAIMIKTHDPDAKKKVISMVKKYSMLEDRKTNPGVVFLETNKIPKEVTDFYNRTVSELVTIVDANKIISSIGADSFRLKNGRGVIGALAAIGFNGKKTYEIIAYRKSKKYVKKRKISRESVLHMNDLLFPSVFDNVDVSGKRILITPLGRDPVYCGIRGISQRAVLRAWEMIEPLEPIEVVQVFETNQATDAHLRPRLISQIKPYDCVIVSGCVTSEPKKVMGGHVIFSLRDDTGSIDCAAYKPSRDFREVVSLLRVGDEIKASGGIGKYRGTINIEKIEVTQLSSVVYVAKPLCCEKVMSSAGRNKGLKCKKCGKKQPISEAIVTQRPRSLSLGVYDVPAGSRRHLSRPTFLD